MTAIETVRLILVEIGENSNKQWKGILYDNGDVETRWGRVGQTEQSKRFPSMGKAFLDKKKKEKLKKGYTEVRTMATEGVSVSTPAKSDLHQIALEQIKTSSPELTKLIKRLVEVNIHTITSQTQVSYNSASGLFTTPLGVVTLDGISDARNLLADLSDLIKARDYNEKTVQKVNQYLRIVPQDIGMRRLEVRNFFPDIQSVQKQNDILDSLEASYQALTAPRKRTTRDVKDAQGNVIGTIADDSDPVREQVFNVKLDLLEDPREIKRIEDKYRATRKDMHVCAHLRVKKIYVVQIESQYNAYQIGRKVGTEMELWHGTKQANLLSILKSGLKVSPPSTARIAGKMFGNGVYFAIDSTKSLNYSYGYWDGQREKNCFMFLCPVALGRYYVPRGSYESLPKHDYDSTWAKSGQSGVRNDEIIVYRNDRFDLKYLVEFE